MHAGKLIKPEALPTDQGATLVQANIPITESDVWSLEYFEQTLSSLQALSVRPRSETALQRPGLIVWPESPAPFWATDLHLRRTLADIARDTNSYVIAGSLGIDHTGEPGRRPEIYNSASVISPTGAWTSRYDKIHLVPFGEYVPFEKLFSFAGGLTRQVGTFARGKSRMPLNVGDSQAGVFICYESIFPNEVRQLRAARGRVLREHFQRRLVRRGRRAAAAPEHGAHARRRESIAGCCATPTPA